LILSLAQFLNAHRQTKIPDYIQLSGLEKRFGGPSLIVGFDL
jgi:hypothetical protein